MIIQCVWEHNGDDTLLYAVNLPGAYTRGENLQTAVQKMPIEAISYLKWKGVAIPTDLQVNIVQDYSCDLQIRDADSNVLFDGEKEQLTLKQYNELKLLVLKSAKDFLMLYNAIPDKVNSNVPMRKTFYGQVPRTAEQMYNHTKNVNSYYFGEIGVEVDNNGTILACRRRGFDLLEQNSNFLDNSVFHGSYGESWNLRKLLRRFLWHDRIHAKAMYRMALKHFCNDVIPNVFCFEM